MDPLGGFGRDGSKISLTGRSVLLPIDSGTGHTKALRDTARLLLSKCPRREHFDLEHAGRGLELFADLAPSMKPGKFPVVRGERDRRVSQDTPYIKESMGAAIEW